MRRPPTGRQGPRRGAAAPEGRRLGRRGGCYAARVQRVAVLTRRPESLVAASAFGLAALSAAWIVRPIHVGTLGYDAAASVLYSQRLMAGTTLEAFTGATPKALLTAVYGLAYGLVPDWRVISWLAIAAYAGGIAASAALAHRLSGVGAAAFVAVGLVGSAELLQDVDLAYAVSWALLCWAVAGLLATGSRPRFAPAGIVLAIGGLARFETLLIVGLAGLVLVVGATIARLRGRPVDAFRARAPILLGLLALPIQALHDWLLTGDPLYAEKVPVIGSAGLPLVGVGGAFRAIGNHYAAEPILLALAVLGIAFLVARARWGIVVGLVALGPGVVAFITFLALRQIYISDRYIAPADVALTFAAAIGLGSLRVPALEAPLRGTLSRLGPVVVAVIVGSMTALAVIRPFGPLDLATRSAITVNAAVHRDVARVVPDLLRVLADVPGIRASPKDGSPTRAMGSRAIVLAPVLTVPQLAVELQLPLSSISGTVGASIATDGTYPRPGQVVFHQVDRDQPRAPFALFEVDRPTPEGHITVVPLLVDPDHRFWLVRIAPRRVLASAIPQDEICCQRFRDPTPVVPGDGGIPAVHPQLPGQGLVGDQPGDRPRQVLGSIARRDEPGLVARDLGAHHRPRGDDHRTTGGHAIKELDRRDGVPVGTRRVRDAQDRRSPELDTDLLVRGGGVLDPRVARRRSPELLQVDLAGYPGRRQPQQEAEPRDRVANKAGGLDEGFDAAAAGSARDEADRRLARPGQRRDDLRVAAVARDDRAVAIEAGQRGQLRGRDDEPAERVEVASLAIRRPFDPGPIHLDPEGRVLRERVIVKVDGEWDRSCGRLGQGIGGQHRGCGQSRPRAPWSTVLPGKRRVETARRPAIDVGRVGSSGEHREDVVPPQVPAPPEA